MRWKAETGEKGARAWVCDASDMTRQFSVAVWAVYMICEDHNDLLDLQEELAAAKRIIDQMIPKRDGLTVDDLIRGELRHDEVSHEEER